jgi:hypothetical protein
VRGAAVAIVYFWRHRAQPGDQPSDGASTANPVNTCTSVIKVYRCMRDLDSTARPRRASGLRRGQQGIVRGSDAMDNKSSAFNVAIRRRPGPTAERSSPPV